MSGSFPSRTRTVRGAGILLLLVAASAGSVAAQVSPAGHWRTLHSSHFRVHFQTADSVLARRAAATGERSWALLAAELVPPREKVDLVVSSAADFSNGAADVFPSDRIVLLLTPPSSQPGLQNYDDWLALVLTHELTHIFHLDRVRGPWTLLQDVLGRAPGSFPNAYQPSWAIEGLAVYYESRLSRAGRLRDSYHTRILAAAAAAHRWPQPNEATYLSERWPDGVAPYAFGSRFLEQVADEAGSSAIPELVERTAGQWIPTRTGRPLRAVTGLDPDSLWRDLRNRYRALLRAFGPDTSELVEGGLRADPQLAISPTGAMAWVATPGDRAPEIVVRRNGRQHRYLTSGGVHLAWRGDTLYATWLEHRDPYHYRADLHRLRNGRWEQVTYGARLTDLAAGPAGVLAVQVTPAGNRLVRVAGDSIAVLLPGALERTWATPAMNPAGGTVVLIRRAGSDAPRDDRQALVVLDSGGSLRPRDLQLPLTGLLADPSWAGSDTLLVADDETGLPQVYLVPAGAAPVQLTAQATGAGRPVLAPDGWLYFTALEADGFALRRLRYDPLVRAPPPPGPSFRLAGDPPAREPPEAPAGSDPPPWRETGYAPWAALLPHYYLPTLADKGPAGVFLGLFTTGSDPIGRVAYTAEGGVGLNTGRVEGDLSLVYSRWDRFALDLYLNQRWGDAGTISTPVSAAVRSRERNAELGLSTIWRGWRRALNFRLAGDYEQDAFFADVPVGFRTPEWLGASGTAAVSRLVFTPLGISAEDGGAVSLRYHRRWRLDQPGWSDDWRLRARGYLAFKGLGLFAHPVLAARFSAATSYGPEAETYGVGGASGGTYRLLPGVVLSGQRTYPVRGYAGSEIAGRTVASGSLEFRVPLALVDEGLGHLPYGLDRISLAPFYDEARIWRPVSAGPERLASTGVEVSWDLGVLYDVPLRLRTWGAVTLLPGPTTRRGALAAGLGFGSDF